MVTLSSTGSTGHPGRVELYGTIEREQEGQILFRVKLGVGDAANCGFRRECAVWLAKRQLVIHEATVRGELDRIELSPSLAVQKAAAAREAMGCR